MPSATDRALGPKCEKPQNEVLVLGVSVRERRSLERDAVGLYALPQAIDDFHEAASDRMRPGFFRAADAN
jgi:hypothetical protein